MTHRFAALFAALVIILSTCLPLNLKAQRTAVSPNVRYHRVIALVHLTGSGRGGDIIRPEYVSNSRAVGRSGILGWSVMPTDDGKMAIVQYVAADRAAFRPLFADKRPGVRVFEIGRSSRVAIETEMRKYRRDFDLDRLEVNVH